MLVLTRKRDQAIIIGDKIEITVLEIKGDQIRIGISAPKDVPVFRKEVYTEIEQENKAALKSTEGDLRNIAEIIRKNM